MNRLVLLSLVLVTVLAGCGYTVESAREAAAQHTCDYAVRCNQVGTGKTYASRDECLTTQRSAYLTAWPTSTCANSLDSGNIDLCLKAWDATACDNLLALASTLVECSPLAICRAPGDGG
jgi:Family of unknown function (DUF6184)